MVQLSQLGRVVTCVAISNGVLKTASAGATSWTTPTNNSGTTPAFSTTVLPFSAQNGSKLWIVDGEHYRYYDGIAGTVEAWTASAGTLPIDGSSNTARLICTWRGRTVLSGVILDPQNWYMSAVDAPRDFDYAPSSTTPTQAIAGNNAPQGLMGDVITSLIPYSDDVLVLGGDHSIYMMAGDPMSGGSIDLVSDRIGIAWGNAWIKGPDGTLYFFSNRTGIYSLVPGQVPQRISQPIDNILQDLTLGTYAVNMAWSDRFQGFHVFITATAAVGSTTHYFYEQRNGAWWQDEFNNTSHNPVTCVQYDGNNPDDRVVLIGGWDGYVRYLDNNASDDDTRPIQSEVILGPILTQNFDEMMVSELQAILGSDSGNVTMEVMLGTTAEQALAQGGFVPITLVGGRNGPALIRRSSHVVYVRLTSEEQWRMEGIRARVRANGKVRMRQIS